VEVSPQLAVLAERPPTGDQWIHEIKFDGYRFLAHVQRGRVLLITRNGKDWTDRFHAVAEALKGLKATTAILDGEAVVLDAEGRSDFQALQAMLKDEKPATPDYYVFDLLYLNGEDLRDLPLIDRKQQLAKLLKTSRLGKNIHYSQHTEGDAAKLLHHACEMGLEGIISKRSDAPYVSRRDYSWLKSKCEQRQEFVILGYTDPQGGRVAFGSLLIGYHDSQGRLVYAGRVGTGFDDSKLRNMLKTMQALAIDKSPTDVPPPRREIRRAHWIKPKLVAEIRFTGWTRDNVLRHPVFIALRSDKPASQIVRENAVDPNQSELKEGARKSRNGQPLHGGNGAPRRSAHRSRR
jgi:bifunctional non-homologous end joining protein LigD